MTHWRHIIALASTSIFASALQASAATSLPQKGDVVAGMVENVFDGDGVWIGNGDGNPKNDIAVRLFGIDAPEWNRPGGQDAKKFLSRRIKRQRVRCIVQVIDQYNRPVGICTDQAGRDLSCAVLWAGHAVVTHPKYARCDRVRQLLNTAPPARAPF